MGVCLYCVLSLSVSIYPSLMTISRPSALLRRLTTASSDLQFSQLSLTLVLYLVFYPSNWYRAEHWPFHCPLHYAEPVGTCLVTGNCSLILNLFAKFTKCSPGKFYSPWYFPWSVSLVMNELSIEIGVFIGLIIFVFAIYIFNPTLFDFLFSSWIIDSISFI